MRVLVAAIMLMQCAAVIALAAIFSVVHEQSTRHKIVAVICIVVLLASVFIMGAGACLDCCRAHQVSRRDRVRMDFVNPGRRRRNESGWTPATLQAHWESDAAGNRMFWRVKDHERIKGRASMTLVCIRSADMRTGCAMAR
jgi:hypothetical protein